nr:hypothetical protein [Actinomycetota bacterium]
MSERRVRRFVADLLRGRRPVRFRVEEHEAAELRAAIALRAARPGAGTPREEFVTDLHRRLAEHVGEPAHEPAHDPGPDPAIDPASHPGPIGPRSLGRPDGISRRRLVAT